MTDEFSEFLRSNSVPSFPRDFGLPRRSIYDREHFNTVLGLAHGYNTHVSVYSQYEWEHSVASTLFFDVDGETYFDSLKFMLKVEPVLKQFAVRVYYTGNRGFHFYVDFQPVVLDVRRSAHRFLDLFFDGVEWDRYLDKQVIGDMRHMARLPGTVHEDTGSLSRLVSKYDGKTSPLEFFETGHVPLSLSYARTNIVGGTIAKHPPCVLFLLEKLRREHDLTHYQRIHLASYLLSVFKREDIVDLFRLASDYNKGKTEYYVDYLSSRDWRPFGCFKARQHGICPIPLQQAECPFYPNCGV
ncbi:MAG: hypothetical protein QXO47_10635 [Thermoproteota archaeon]